MGDKPSGKALRRLSSLEEAKRKLDRIHGLVEQLASARSGEEAMLRSVGRATAEVARLFADNALAVMADTAGKMAMIASRGGGLNMKVRALREMVGSLRANLETQARVIAAEDTRETA